MSTSEARRAANIQNCQSSTGPTSEIGLRVASQNATTHGLTSKTLPTDDPAFEELAGTLRAALKPVDEVSTWLVAEVAAAMTRIERAEGMEDTLRAEISTRAQECWDADRRAEVAALAAGLGRKPEVVLPRLRTSLHGVEWLLERWERLAGALGRTTPWTPEQRQLADDLRGIPGELRDRRDLTSPVVLVREQAEIARAEIEALKSRVEGLSRVDQQARANAVRGLVDDSPQIRRIRRYAGSLHRRLKWGLAQLGVDCLADLMSAPAPQPSKPVEAPKPISAPAPIMAPAQARLPSPAIVDDETKPTPPAIPRPVPGRSALPTPSRPVGGSDYVHFSIGLPPMSLARNG